MSSRIRTIVLLVLGSFLVYCVQAVGNRGMVGNAGAGSGGSCGCPPPTRTVIFDGTVTLAAESDKPAVCVSPAWDISPFSQVIVHTVPGGDPVYVQYQYGQAGFMTYSAATDTGALNGGITTLPAQLGSKMRFIAQTNCANLRNPPTMTVVGLP